MTSGGGEGETLAPSVGKRSGGLRADGVKVELVQRLFGQTGHFAGREAVAPRVEADVFLDGEIGVEGEALRHVADSAKRGRALRLQSVTANLDAARSRPHKSAEGANQRGLAGSIGSGKTVDIARGELEAYGIEHDLVAVANREIVSVQDGHAQLTRSSHTLADMPGRNAAAGLSIATWT